MEETYHKTRTHMSHLSFILSLPLLQAKVQYLHFYFILKILQLNWTSGRQHLTGCIFIKKKTSN